MKIIVCQRGARHRYAIPIIFNNLCMLEALYTDTTAYSLLGSLSRLMIKTTFKHPCLTKIATRRISEIPKHKIFTKDNWSDILNYDSDSIYATADSLAPVYQKWGTRNADCIYTMNTADYPFLLYAKKNGLKIIVDSFINPLTDDILRNESTYLGLDCIPFTKKSEWMRNRYQIVAEVADILLCPSQWVADGWIKLFPNVSTKIRICPYGSSLSISNTINLHPEKIILFAGRDPMRKGLLYFAQAAKLVQKQYPDWKFAVAGISEEDVTWINERHHLVFLGNLPLDKMRVLYEQAYAFVLPSLSEGQAGVILEAIASACPVIATRESGVDFSSSVGITIPSRNTQSIVDAVISIIEHYDQRQSYAIASLKYANYFSLESWSKRLLSIVNSIEK